MGWDDPVVGGIALRRAAIRSPNYQQGLLGWTINQDGSAEFNNLTIRGTFDGTDFEINTNGAFFYSSAPALGNLVASVASLGGTDAFGNHYSAGFATYDQSNLKFANLQASLLTIGGLSGAAGSTPNFSTAFSLSAGATGLTVLTGCQEAGIGFTDVPVISLFAGQPNEPTGAGLNPVVQLVDSAGTSAIDGLVSGNWIRANNAGTALTWQTPSMAAGFTNTTLKYRLDICDNVQWTGQFTQTTGVAGAAGATIINAVPAAYRPKHNYIAPVAWLSSTNVAKGAALAIIKTDGTIALEWPSSTANGDQFGFIVSMPLENIA